LALLFYSPDDDPEAWREALRAEIADLDFRVWPEMGDVEAIDCALVWLPPPGLLASLPNLKAVFCLGAGVDAMLEDATLPDLPLCRMIDPSLTRGMSEFVLTQVLKYHRELDLYAAQQKRGLWQLHLPKEPGERVVGLMGLGELGLDAARQLRLNGFRVRGWARSAKEVQGVETFAGREALADFVGGLDILVCLLPLTAETRGILDAALFAALPRGARLIHLGRGAQLNADDLLAALERGHLAHVSLDVLPEEPLPPESRLWRHPLIDITPHAASYCQPRSAAATVAENIRRLERGEPLRGVVDRERGY